jgi:hypothetical protein
MDAYDFSTLGCDVYGSWHSWVKSSRKENSHEKQIQQKRLQHGMQHALRGVREQQGA